MERVLWPSGGQLVASRATHAGKSAVQDLGNLSNEIGSFQGSQIGEVPEGVFWLRSLADGTWSVQMREVQRLLTHFLTLGLPLAGFVLAAVRLISVAFTVAVSSIA